MTSKPEIITIPATIEDCQNMAKAMRKVDAEEIWASGPWLPLQALMHSVESSDEAWSVFLGDQDQTPILMYGIVHRKRVFDEKSAIWMLATDRLKEIKREFVRDCGRDLARMAAGRTVFNYVSVDNDVSIRWLKWLGFDIMPAEEYGWLKKPFHYFERTFPCVNPQP